LYVIASFGRLILGLNGGEWGSQTPQDCGGSMWLHMAKRHWSMRH
jgi:hypothetical protein